MTLPSAAWLEKKLRGRRVLIDTNVVIYLTDAVEPYAPLARAVFEGLEAGQFNGVLSLVTVAEVMGGPLKKGLTDIAFRARDYLLNFPNAKCQPVDSAVIHAVGGDPRIRWERLRAPDALIVASGLVQQADLFLSNDLAWRGAVDDSLLVTLDECPLHPARD